MKNILALCLTCSFIISPTAAAILAPCSTALFPLIFGGSGNDTIMKTFDLWQQINDYKIVAGGFTYDQSIAVTSTIEEYPIIIMYSGSLTSSINPIWGKVINDPQYQVSGIKIDSNGEYVVAHAEHNSDTQNMIIVIRANLLANQYKMVKYANSIDSYNYRIKNLILSDRNQYNANYFRIFLASTRSFGTQKGFNLQAYNFHDDMISNPVSYNFNSQF